jgi:hypothetical protein
MSFDNLFNLIFSINPWSLVKIMVSFALFLYVIFAGIMVRQVSLMTESLKLGLEWPLKMVAFLHFLGAAFIFLMALIVL